MLSRVFIQKLQCVIDSFVPSVCLSVPFLYKNKIHRFSCIDFLWHFFVCSALNVLSAYCIIVKVWNINSEAELSSLKGYDILMRVFCLTKYILIIFFFFCDNEISFSYRIDFYCTYWFGIFLPVKDSCIRCLVVLWHVPVHVLLYAVTNALKIHL